MDEFGSRTLETVQHFALDLVQPPVVLDHANHAQESGTLLCGQEEDDATLRALGLHGGSLCSRRPAMGVDSVNGGRMSG